MGPLRNWINALSASSILLPALIPAVREISRRFVWKHDRVTWSRPTGNGYAIAVDSKGFPWVRQLDLGIIFKLDPDTGKTTSYHTPEMRSTRGIAVDAQDNVWFADYYGNKLGKLDPNSGEVKLYQPPTPNSSPYGVTVDIRRNYIWFADTVGNDVTVTAWLIEGALESSDNCPKIIQKAFDGKHRLEVARGMLTARLSNPNAAFRHRPSLCRSRRPEPVAPRRAAIREAISALKAGRPLR
jgi:DNA-binding beta-propeller fold protein YncE